MDSLGIDIGGSGIKGAVVDTQTGELVAPRFRLQTPEKGRPKDITKVILRIIKHFNWDRPVGVGFPSVVIQGIIKTAANIDPSWIGINAENLLQETSGIPVHVLNDADAAGIAEINFGAGRAQKNGLVIVVTLGTGIGTAIFSGGVLVRNAEFGHLKIRGKDAEIRASDAARQKKKLSWKKWSARLSEYLQEMEKLFWPDLFIIGGGISEESERFFPYLKLRTKIVRAELLNQAGIVGAAVYAIDNIYLCK